jgi:hypothetical protein
MVQFTWGIRPVGACAAPRGIDVLPACDRAGEGGRYQGGSAFLVRALTGEPGLPTGEPGLPTGESDLLAPEPGLCVREPAAGYAAQPASSPLRVSAETSGGLPDTEGDATEEDVVEALGEEICTLAAHISAATQRLLELLAEFDRRGGWKAGGHRSCAHWLHFRTGIDLGACREKVRVARALEGLPETRASMGRGELSFSKVRALTRAATEETERELLPIARKLTAGELERVIRSWSEVDRGRNEAEVERRRHARRHLSVAPDGAGMYVVRGCLTPEVGALLMRAVEAASDALLRPGETWGAAGGRRGPLGAEVTPRQRRADALGLLAERALAAGFGGKGEEGETGAEEEADESPEPPLSGTRAERYQVFLHVDRETLAKEAASQNGARPEGGAGSRSFLQDGTRVSAETSRRLCCDAAVVRVQRSRDGSVLDVGRRTRTIPPALRRALEVRDGGCRFPGCGLRFTEGHHIVHWGDGGETKLSNLVLLCRFHHRAVHEEGFRVKMGRDGQTVRFFDPLGWPLPDMAPPPRLTGGDLVEELMEANRARGADPDGDTQSSWWKRVDDMPLVIRGILDEVILEGLEQREGREGP